MVMDVVMPQMGEAILEVTVTRWLKKTGERVGRDESLFEVSTDKVDSEIPSPGDGFLGEILVPAGATVKVGTVVATIQESAGAAFENAQPGELVAAPLPEAAVNEPAVLSAPDRELSAALSANIDGAEPLPPSGKDEGKFIHTSPLVRRLARAHGVHLSTVSGTGLSGRITSEDIRDHLQKRDREEPAAIPEAPKAPAAGMPTLSGDREVVAMTPMRKAIADHMIASRRNSAHVQTVFEVDMTAVVNLREENKAAFEARAGCKLTYTPFFAHALIEAIRAFPILNSSIADDTIIYKKAVNLGIAVALETGLIVPVVKDAHVKAFPEIAYAIRDLAERARTKKLKPEEVQNGTITISNPGVYGALFGIPIINQPQVAILGVGGLRKRAVVINDAIAIRPMIYLVLSFDHRIIDGAVADQAMALLKSRLEAWREPLF